MFWTIIDLVQKPNVVVVLVAVRSSSPTWLGPSSLHLPFALLLEVPFQVREFVWREESCPNDCFRQLGAVRDVPTRHSLAVGLLRVGSEPDDVDAPVLVDGWLARGRNSARPGTYVTWRIADPSRCPHGGTGS